MTSVGPDLLLPGVASKKPTPATAGDRTPSSENAAGDSAFAQELDAAVSPEAGAATADDTSTGTTTAQAEPAPGTASETTPTPDAATAAIDPGIDVAELQLFTAPPTGELPTSNDDTDKGIVPAAPLMPPIAVSGEQVDIPQGEGLGSDDGNELLAPLAASQASTGPAAPNNAQSQGGIVAPASTSTATQQQGPNPNLVAGNLAVDPRGLAASDPDGGQNTNLQSNDKPVLRGATTLAPDIRPAETSGSQSFSSALSAASSESAGQANRTAAEVAAQRPARPAQTAPATAQIAVHIVRAVADGVSRFSVQLQPAELGRVEVKMEVSRDGAVRALVMADRQETVDQLQRDSRALERALQEAGLKADSQNLQFSLRGGQNGRDLSENRTSIGNSGDADLTEVPEPALAAHWSNVAGSTGALDIRV